MQGKQCKNNNNIKGYGNMINVCRGDFINYLKSGNVYVVGTVNGGECFGIFTNQGTTNAMNYSGKAVKVPFKRLVGAELENITSGTTWKTTVRAFIPKPLYELTDEERESCGEEDLYKGIAFNNKTAFIEFGENDDYIVIKSNEEDKGVKRCINGTTYGNKDKSYRTSYYYDGNFRVNNQNYCLVSEGIEFDIEDRYVPLLFIVYAVRTNKILNLCRHSNFGTEKSDEEIEEELRAAGMRKGKKKKKRGFRNE